MPGRLFLTREITDVADFLDVDCTAVKNEKPRHNIAPGQEIIVLDQGQLKRMRWGILPVSRVNARGRPVMETIINARSETVFQKSAFEGVRRCIIPIDGWYEWTGEKRKKTSWRIKPKEGGLLLFAGIADTWAGPGGVVVDQVAAVTCEPNRDLKPVHHRMAVILPPEKIDVWLSSSSDEASKLMVPYPNGLLDISRAIDVDWTAP